MFTSLEWNVRIRKDEADPLTDPPIDGVVVHHAHDRAEGLVELPQPVRGVLPSINSGHSQVHETSGGPGNG